MNTRNVTLPPVVLAAAETLAATLTRAAPIADYHRAKARLEGLVDSNQKTFNEFGAMLTPDQQAEARQIMEAARTALESGSAGKCTEALEKIAQMGKILSEVILYDPGQFSSGDGTEVDPEV